MNYDFSIFAPFLLEALEASLCYFFKKLVLTIKMSTSQTSSIISLVYFFLSEPNQKNHVALGHPVFRSNQYTFESIFHCNEMGFSSYLVDALLLGRLSSDVHFLFLLSMQYGASLDAF